MKKYDITPVEVFVQISGKDFVIVETSEWAQCKWKNTALENMEFDSNGKPKKLSGMANGDAVLVSMCLYEIFKKKDDPTKEDHRNQVSVDAVRAWPSRVVEDILKTIKKISGIEEAEDDTVKNSSSENEKSSV